MTPAEAFASLLACGLTGEGFEMMEITFLNTLSGEEVHFILEFEIAYKGVDSKYLSNKGHAG